MMMFNDDVDVYEKLIAVCNEIAILFPQTNPCIKTDFLGRPYISFLSPTEGCEARLTYKEGLWYPNRLGAGTASILIAFQVARVDAENNNPFAADITPGEVSYYDRTN